MHENARSSTLYYGKKSSFLGINLTVEARKKQKKTFLVFLHTFTTIPRTKTSTALDFKVTQEYQV